MNKRGGMTDLFLLSIFSLIIVLACGIFIYIGGITSSQLHSQLDNQSTAEVNYTVILQQTIDQIPPAYYILKWGSAALIFGMIISIFIGSYLVTTKPIYFVPYSLVVIIATILGVVISNSYDQLLSDPTLGPIYVTFVASNFFLLNMPIVIPIVGLIGGIIMYAAYRIGGAE